MSTLFYNKLWADAQSELNSVIEKDAKATTNFQTLAMMYIKYLSIMRMLDECYDQMIHVQKRMVIRRLLDGTIGRTLEIRHEIVNVHLSEIISFEETLIEMHLTHVKRNHFEMKFCLYEEALEVPIPKYFRQDRLEELELRTSVIDEMMIKYGLQKPGGVDDGNVSTVEEAVCLIQRMERARQGKLRAHFMCEIYMRKQKEQAKGGRIVPGPGPNIPQIPSDDQPSMDPQTAALKIQQMWKGYITWKKIQEERQEEMIFLGMAIPPKSMVNFNEIRLHEIAEHRRRLQSEEEEIYQKMLVNIKRDIIKKEGPDIVEKMQKEIRNWFFAYKERTGKFPEYPTVDQGGYETILAKGDAKDDNHTRQKKGKKTSIKNRTGRRLSTIKNPGDGDAPLPPRQSSTFLPDIAEANLNFLEVWKVRVLTGSAIEIEIDDTIIRTDKRCEVNRELRIQVDELMRQELEHLKIALLKDKGKKGKKLRAAMRKEQKKKPKTAKRKRKERDSTAQRSLDALLEELVKKGIVKKYQEVFLKEFLGEPNYVPMNPDKKRDFIATRFSQADVRHFVTEYCILPLGCIEVHSKAPLNKSVLLTGPTKSGKTMLVNAVCTETGATLFDLSATNLMGKYPGREGIKQLMHLVLKVGKLMQPSVIVVEDAEKMFAKKIPKTDKTDPKRIKKGLAKLVKSISTEDRILLMGLSRSPFDGDMKGLASMYNKIVCLPRPDHASRFALWRQLVEARGGQLASNVDLSTLTKVSDGYTSGSIAFAISQTLTPHRVALQKRRTLQGQEFIKQLAKYQPVYREEEQAMIEWYLRTPLVRKKIASLQPKEKRTALTKKKQDADNKDKKKKKRKKNNNWMNLDGSLQDRK